MIPELGHFALALALVAALFQFVVPLYGFRVNDRALMATAAPASLVQVALVALAFAALMWSYIVSDFSVENVYQNSHSAKPLLYKISGVWGNHEGSMVLWVLILAVFGAAVGLMGCNLPDGLRALVLSVQASISVAFLMFLLFTSNPFVRLPEVPIEGNGLNPLLQDPALAFHPPFLYGGYVGLSVSFAFAIAALIEGRVDAAWARWVRPWTLAAWMSLTPVARRHRAPPLGYRGREAQRAEDLDHLPRHSRLLALPRRHVPRALGRAHLGSRLRRGS